MRTVNLRCAPWRAKRRRVNPGSREAALLIRMPVLLMILWCCVARGKKPKRRWPRSRRGWSRMAYGYILTKPRWATAWRRVRGLNFWGIGLRPVGVGYVRKAARHFGIRSERRPVVLAVVAWKPSSRNSIPSSGAGLATSSKPIEQLSKTLTDLSGGG